MNLLNRRMLVLMLALILSASGAFGMSVTGGTANSQASLSMKAPTNGAVNGNLALADGNTFPVISGSGDLDPTYSISDGTGKKAEVSASITGAATYVWSAWVSSTSGNYYHSVAGDTSDHSFLISPVKSLQAEQSLSATGATGVHARATAWTASPSTVPVAEVTFDATDLTSGAHSVDVGNLYQKASSASVTLPSPNVAKATQTVSGIKGDQVTTVAHSAADANTFYDVTQVIRGSTTPFNVFDNALADTAAPLYQSVQTTTGASPTYMTIEDHRKDSTFGDQKVTLVHSGVFPGLGVSPTVTSVNTGTIIQDLVLGAATNGDEIDVTSGLYKENLYVDKDLTIKGVGATKPIIDGNALDSVITTGRIIPTSQLTLDNLVIQNGAAAFGGGINNFATLSVKNSNILNNFAVAAGGIMNNPGAALSVYNTELGGNVATHPFGDGGAIINAGLMHVSMSNIHDNSAAYGGAIYNANTAVPISDVVSTTISGNTAGKEGGAILNQEGATLAVQGNAINGNKAATDGGAIANYGTVTLTDNTISHNSVTDAAAGLGGAIFNAQPVHGTVINPATLTVVRGFIDSNTAAAGGGICNFGKATLTGVSITNNVATAKTGDGGGIVSGDPSMRPGVGNSPNAWLKIDGSTITGNSARYGGGIYTADISGQSYIHTSTVTGNKAKVVVGAVTYTGNGGGILIQRGSGATFDRTGSTITGNTPDQVWL